MTGADRGDDACRRSLTASDEEVRAQTATPYVNYGMTARLATVVLFTSFVLASCAKHDRAEVADKAAPSAAAAGSAAPKDGTVAVPVADPQRKVIRTGRIELVVATYDEARQKLDAMLAAAGGYVDSTQVQHYRGAVSSATLVLRIPQAAFGAIVPALKELGEIAAESTNAEDVTDAFVDVSARLASARTLEKRLLEIAADRAAGVEALLAVERELARVRGEIESYEGRVRQWNDQIAMSTLTLTMTTKTPELAAATQVGVGARIKSGFSESIAALEAFAAWLVVAGTALLPWLILIVPGFVFGRRAYRRYAKKLPTAIATPVVERS